MFDEKKIQFNVGGKDIEIRTGKLARQAAGAVEVQCGNTVLLVTVAVSKEPREGIDFFPLLVDFEEKLYSVGRIPGGYLRREGKASDKAVLISRLIDRPVRPLFPEGYRNDVQITITTLSVDMACPPDTLAMLGAAFALELSGVPFDGPFGAVRIGLDADGKFLINPSEEENLASDLDIVVAGTADSVMMVEAGANFVTEEKIIEALELAQKEINLQTQKVTEFAKLCGVKKQEFAAPAKEPSLTELVEKYAKDDLLESMQNADKAKWHGFADKAKDKVEDALADLLADKDDSDPLVQYLDENPNAIKEELKKFEKKLLRSQILDKGQRADGRKHTEVREICVEVGSLPMVHGDGLFTRGNTQVLGILSLGSEKLAKALDGIDSEEEKHYMHNYNFPSWSVGEVRPNRGPGRREIGHGALAERAIIPALPARDEFPYAIRVVSEVLESSGSTSMGATCASSLAMMNGGVPLKCQVAGVAMGLIKEDNNFVVLTDIHEREDFLGDMDFKVAGNNDGISALQMDIKIKGISIEILTQALAQAKEGRLHILGKMNDVISEPSDKLKPNAPRIISTKIDPDKIGAVIGSGGKNIKWLTEETGCEINITDEGTVAIYTSDEEAGERAKDLVHVLANGVKAGEIWDVKIVKILDGVGALAEIIPGQNGLIHISQIAKERVNNVTDFLNVDDEVQVKVVGVDFKGRISLTIKGIDEELPEQPKQSNNNNHKKKPRKDREEKATAS